MEQQEGFPIPERLLTQLMEFSQGYLLVTVNEEGEIHWDARFDSPALELGVLNYVKMKSKQLDEEFHEGLMDEALSGYIAYSATQQGACDDEEDDDDDSDVLDDEDDED